MGGGGVVGVAGGSCGLNGSAEFLNQSVFVCVSCTYCNKGLLRCC